MTSAKGFDVVWGEATPYAVFLTCVDGVFGAQVSDRAFPAERLCGFCCLDSNFGVSDVLGEENVWDFLTGDTARAVNGEQEFTVGVSAVKHIFSLGGK